MSKNTIAVRSTGPSHPQVVCRLCIAMLKDSVHRKYSRNTFIFFCIKNLAVQFAAGIASFIKGLKKCPKALLMFVA